MLTPAFCLDEENSRGARPISPLSLPFYSCSSAPSNSLLLGSGLGFPLNYLATLGGTNGVLRLKSARGNFAGWADRIIAVRAGGASRHREEGCCAARSVSTDVAT